jgi:hypothetical protein
MLILLVQKITRFSKVMLELGFESHGKEFRHKDIDFFVEFPSGPLAIVNQLIQAEAELNFKGHKLKLLSPTQSVMDRLAAYFHWNDLQCLDQAVWIAKKHPIQIYKIKEWAKREGEEDKLNVFLQNIKNN